jgi:hypothetical protein
VSARIERCELLAEHHAVAPEWHVQHRRHELDPFGALRRHGKGNERIEVVVDQPIDDAHRRES